MSPRVVVVLLWLCYASTYLLRKPLAVVKPSLIAEGGTSLAGLGWLDTSLLLPYATVSLLFGARAEQLGPRAVLCGGLLLAAPCFAALYAFHSLPIMCLLLAGVGAGQALAWPASSIILSAWFKGDSLGYAFALFGSSCYAGSVLATYYSVWVLQQAGWQAVFVACAVPPAVLACVFLLLIPSEQPNHNSEGCKKAEDVPLTFLQVIRLDLLPEICVSIFCTKYIRYSLLLWLPLFLQSGLQYSAVSAGLVSSAFDVGGVLGSLVSGALLQACGGRPMFAISLMTALTTMSLMLLGAGRSELLLLLVLLVAGAAVSAADLLLTGVVAARVGERHRAPLAVAGVINGFGSVGAVVQGPVVGALAESCGLVVVLVELVAVAGCGTMAAYLGQRSAIGRTEDTQET